MTRFRRSSVSMQSPRPPSDLFGSMQGDAMLLLCPAPALQAWTESAIFAPSVFIHNPDHAHLVDADLAFLWASSGFEKAGRVELGEVELVMFCAGGWQKARQEQQMIEWFGRVPAFLITFAADYCAGCTDAEFCALVEHGSTTSGMRPIRTARRPSTSWAGRSCA